MSKEKQIEEMAKLTCNSQRSCYKGDCLGCKICAVRENCEKLYDAGYRKQEWINVDERLPRESEVVLVYNGEILQRIYTSYNNEVRWWSDECWSSTEKLGVTHWMPLPEAPKGGAE